MNKINLKQQIFLQKFTATHVLEDYGIDWSFAGRKTNRYCTLILLLLNSRALDMIIITTINGQIAYSQLIGLY